MAEGVVVPFARAVGADPTAAVTPSPPVRAGRPQVRLRRAAPEVRVAALGAAALPMATPGVPVAIRRGRAAPRLQAAQDAAPTLRPRRPIGAVVTVVLGPHAELDAIEGVAAPVLANGRRMAGEAPRDKGAPQNTVPSPVHQPTLVAATAHEAHGPRAGEVATREVAAGLRGRPSVGGEAPVPRQGVPRTVDVAPAPHAPTEVRAVLLPTAPTVVTPVGRSMAGVVQPASGATL